MTCAHCGMDCKGRLCQFCEREEAWEHLREETDSDQEDDRDE